MKETASRELKRFNHLRGELDGIYHEVSLRLGFSDSAMCVLYTISIFGDTCPLGEIVRLSGLSKQTVNSALRKLEKEGVLYLEAAGPRRKLVHLTQTGLCLAQSTAWRMLAAEDRVFGTWPREDVEKYIELSERFLADLRVEFDKL